MNGFPLWIGDFKIVSERVREAREAGFDYLEVSLDYPWPLEKQFKFSSVVEAIKSNGLEIAFHAPWRDVKLASPIEEIRVSSIKACKRVLEYALSFEPKYVVIHLSTEQALNLPSNYVERKILESSIKSISELIEFEEIVFENVPSGCSEPSHFEALIDSFKELKLCFDFGHAVISRVKKRVEVDVRNLLNEWMSVLRNRVEVLHVHGFKELNGYVKDHVLFSRRDALFNEFIELTKSLKPRYVLFEVFEDESRNPVKPNALSGLISLL